MCFVVSKTVAVVRCAHSAVSGETTQSRQTKPAHGLMLLTYGGAGFEPRLRHNLYRTVFLWFSSYHSPAFRNGTLK